LIILFMPLVTPLVSVIINLMGVIYNCKKALSFLSAQHREYEEPHFIF